MKRTLLILPILLMLVSACEDRCIETYSYIEYTPILEAKADVLTVAVETPRELESPEKLYFKDNYVFIVESGEGIHVINNEDPTLPRSEYFISIPGNHDLAIQNQFLYADNYSDLVVFDVSDIHTIVEVNRLSAAFDYYGTNYLEYWEDPSMLVTGYTETVVETDYEYDCNGGDDVAVNDVAFAETTDFSGVGSEGSGIGGSMARFTINNGYMFAVDQYSIRPFDLSDPSLPESREPTYIGWDIETVFPYNDQLFIGSQSGMHIYDVSTPETPTFLSVFQHANACDPVVVQDDVAFVTLRDGTECNTFTNQLDILDVSDLTNPTLIKSYDMDNPHGLGVREDCLYICEGDYGLKHFNIEDLNNITLVNHFEDIHALDVIPLQDNLLLIGEDGFHQYSGLCEDIIYLSTISF